MASDPNVINTDFENYVPRFIEPISSPVGGHIVSNREWYDLWQLHETQGNHTEQALYDFVKLTAPLRNVVVDGVLQIPMTNILGLSETLEAIVAGDLAAISHNLLPDRDAEDAHPITAISGLHVILSNMTTQLNGVQTLVSAMNEGLDSLAHNDLSDRGAPDSHTIAAITGLSVALGDLQPRVLYGTTEPAAELGAPGDIYIQLEE